MSQRWPQSKTTEPLTVKVLNLNGVIEVEDREKSNNNSNSY